MKSSYFFAAVFCAAIIAQPIQPVFAQASSPIVASTFSIGSLLQVILGLTIVLGFVAGSAWLLKRLRIKMGQGNNTIKIISGAAVGSRERVVLIEVDDTWIVVGVAPGQVRALHTMPRAETVPLIEPEIKNENNFSIWLKKIIERRAKI